VGQWPGIKVGSNIIQNKLPSLFISHGSPMILLDDCPARQFLAGLGRRLSRPDAILMISAHWETPTVTVGSAARPGTIHDFYGFPEQFYKFHYDVTGAPDLAAAAAKSLKASGYDIADDSERGLDHGAWVPLSYMFPDGDIPVAQVSIQPDLGIEHHLALGRALTPLRDDNVLIIGSGNVTHGRRAGGVNETALDWVVEFSEWIYGALQEGRTEDLVNYHAVAPFSHENHPTEDHYVPLLVALGAGGTGAKAERLHASYTYRTISMDTYVFS